MLHLIRGISECDSKNSEWWVGLGGGGAEGMVENP